jgi:hypothetical protein
MKAVIGINIACLVIGAVTLSALKVRENAPAPPEMHWLREVGAGLRHLFGPPALRRATIGFVITVAVIGLTETLVFAYVDQGLHRPPAFVSVLVCVQGSVGSPVACWRPASCGVSARWARPRSGCSCSRWASACSRTPTSGSGSRAR